MPRRSIAVMIVLMAVSLTAALSWFALRNYHSATPLADDNLRGLALTIAAAMEGVAERDPSLQTLASFQSREIAYAVLISPRGKILFHSNPDLIGADVGDQRFRYVLTSATLVEERVRLGTGEYVYEFQTPFHLSGKSVVLRLALHTWRSEAVMRRARFGIALIFSLLAIGWGLGITVFWLLRRQKIQEEASARQQQLVRLGEVGAVLAHEVRNPLAGIKGYGQLLQERLPAGRERDYAQLIVRESLRLEQLTDDILFFTRSEAGCSQSGSLSAVTARLTTLLAPQLDAARITMVVSDMEQPDVRCSEEDMHRLLLNLLTNAIQAQPDGGTVVLAARTHGDMVEITVQDNGPGIEEGKRAELFEPFRTTKARGAGLGLAVCRKIAEGCGGRITVQDSADGGALFVVSLPAVICQEVTS